MDHAGECRCPKIHYLVDWHDIQDDELIHFGDKHIMVGENFGCIHFVAKDSLLSVIGKTIVNISQNPNMNEGYVFYLDDGAKLEILCGCEVKRI